MITLYPSAFSPKCSDEILIYHDSDDPCKFHYMNSRPRISIDSKTQKPLLSFSLIKRNAKSAVKEAKEGLVGEADYSQLNNTVESQLGYLNMSVDLGIDNELLNKIQEELVDMVSRSEYLNNTVKNCYPKIYEEFKNSGLKKRVFLTPAVFRSGTANLDLWEGLDGQKSFIKKASHSTEPALSGTCRSTFVTAFGAEGAQLMYNTLWKGLDETAETNVPTNASVVYNMHFSAVCPFTAKVSIDYSSLHSRIQKVKEQLEAYYSQNFTGKVELPKNIQEMGISRIMYNHGEVAFSDEDINKILSNVAEENSSIMIDIQDYGGGGEEEKQLKQQIVSSLIGTITENVIPNLFEVSAAPEQSLNLDQNGGASEPEDKKHLIQSQYYILNDSYTNTANSQQSIVINKSDCTDMIHTANMTLMQSLDKKTAEELVKILDLEEFATKIRVIPVSAFANYEADKIVKIDVDVRYEAIDAQSKTNHSVSEIFEFRSNEDRFELPVNIARDEQGNFIEKFKYRTRAFYLNRDVQGIDKEGWGPFMEIDSQCITVHQQDLGYLNILCQSKSIDWNIVQDAYVSIEYLAAKDKSDTNGEIHLTEDQKEGRWSCYKHGCESNEYSYVIRYINKDGKEYTSRQMTGKDENLQIEDMLVDTLRATFNVIMSEAVKKVEIAVLYEDHKLGIHEQKLKTFTSNDSWDFETRIMEGAVKAYKYKYIVEYNDGVVESSEWSREMKEGDAGPILDFSKSRVTLQSMIVAVSSLDWDKWDVISVRVKYDSAKHNYHVEQIYELTSANKRFSINILGFADELKLLKFEAECIGINGEYEVRSQEVNLDGGADAPKTFILK